ncbi:hypothetical protein BGZ95_001304 [Linnemannia exigua]|uniref:Uncharacterized protein n=1 Tax=Linnemannia exigua TaxID=604196 RepID=A0AAD4H454_9FUNG|nr:hypothetical protein BGZ95_001304 [Linnemannia exigua]
MTNSVHQYLGGSEICAWATVLFAGVCVAIVMSDGMPSKQKSYGSTMHRDGPNSNGGVPRSSRTTMETVIREFLGLRTLMIKFIGLDYFWIDRGENEDSWSTLLAMAPTFSDVSLTSTTGAMILSAAAASRGPVAFGAPIGGVSFSPEEEEVSYYFPSKIMWRTFFGALISVVDLKIGRHPVRVILICDTLTCAIQRLNPWTKINLLQLLTNLYSDCSPENNFNEKCATDINHIYSIFLLLAEVFAVCEGDIMCRISSGLYAMIGAAAFLSGVTCRTVPLVVIMFEPTGAMKYSLPIMMAVMMGNFVGDAFSPDAFF